MAKKFKEPVLIKAGSDKIRLGDFQQFPLVDCRVVSEDYYQELKKGYSLVCEGKNDDASENTLPIDIVRRMLRLDSKKLYEKRIYVSNSGDEWWYTAEVRRLGFLWRSRWRELTPTMQPTYKDAENLFRNFMKWVKITDKKPSKDGIYKVIEYSKYGVRLSETYRKWIGDVGFQPLDYGSHGTWAIDLEITHWLEYIQPTPPMDEAEALVQKLYVA